MARKRYRGAEVDVTFDADVCIHAAECVRGLPAVFDTSRRPWIVPDNAPAAEVAEVVGRCPSGALRTASHDTREHDDALVDEMERESFPASDPPQTWAGHGPGED